MKMARIEPWQQKLLKSGQLLRIILAEPSYSPPLRLALNGEEIMRRARETAARGELEISGAFRRR
jgi:hypothetical protein